MIVSLIRAHLFEPLRIGGANEVGLHIVDAPLWVHQVLVVLAFDLDHSHDDTIDHVNGLAFVFLSLGPLIVLIVLHALGKVVHIVVVSFLVDAVLEGGTSAIEDSSVFETTQAWLVLVSHIVRVNHVVNIDLRFKLNIVQRVKIAAIFVLIYDVIVVVVVAIDVVVTVLVVLGVQMVGDGEHVLVRFSSIEVLHQIVTVPVQVCLLGLLAQ